MFFYSFFLKNINIDYNFFLKKIRTNSTGTIVNIYDNIIVIKGLDDSFVGEIINLNSVSISSHQGIVMNLELELIKVMIIKGDQTQLIKGSKVFRTYGTVTTRSGFGVLGQIISPLGKFLSFIESDFKKYAILYVYTVEIHQKSPSIIDREAVCTPFLTGILSIDCFIPIGCGQRQLIIGDINSGKTSLALTSIINQSKFMNILDKSWRLFESSLKTEWKYWRFMPCVFVAIGKKRSEVIRIRHILSNFNALYYTCIVFTSSDSYASLQYLAPYAGAAIGEWFRDKGYNSVVIYDDLSQHAIAYRQISLLLRRPPGREAYPGDIFYIHSRLLERAAQLIKSKGAGSLTALPLVETQGNDISAYIPTNIISITDGQIFLSPAILNSGIRPGIDLGLSVSRVGSRAQYDSMKFVCKQIKLDYIFFRMYEGLTKFGSDIDPSLRLYIEKGYKLNRLMTQELFDTKSLIEEVYILLALSEGYLDDISINLLDTFFNIFFSRQFISIYLTNKDYYHYFTTNNIILESLFRIGNFSALVDDLRCILSLYKIFFKSNIDNIL